MFRSDTIFDGAIGGATPESPRLGEDNDARGGPL